VHNLQHACKRALHHARTQTPRDFCDLDFTSERIRYAATCMIIDHCIMKAQIGVLRADALSLQLFPCSNDPFDNARARRRRRCALRQVSVSARGCSYRAIGLSSPTTYVAPASPRHCFIAVVCLFGILLQLQSSLHVLHRSGLCLLPLLRSFIFRLFFFAART
jgi:hypothetical protein